MFMPAAARESDAYRGFWERLRDGDYEAGEFGRIGKGGKCVFLQASYNPIVGANGTLGKVVKFAGDITQQVERRRAPVKPAAALPSSHRR